MVEVIAVCVICGTVADTEPDRCDDCNDHDGILYVSKKDWFETDIEIEDMTRYDEDGKVLLFYNTKDGDE